MFRMRYKLVLAGLALIAALGTAVDWNAQICIEDPEVICGRECTLQSNSWCGQQAPASRGCLDTVGCTSWDPAETCICDEGF